MSKVKSIYARTCRKRMSFTLWSPSPDTIPDMRLYLQEGLPRQAAQGIWIRYTDAAQPYRLRALAVLIC